MVNILSKILSPFTSLFEAPLPAKKTFYVDQLFSIKADWVPAVIHASQSVGQVYTANGSFLSCGLLVGVDRIILPLHALSGICLSDIRINFWKTTHSCCYHYVFEVHNNAIEIRQDEDVCILQIRCDIRGELPGNYLTIPQISQIPNDNNFFFLHVIDGRLAVGFGDQCGGSSFRRHFCSTTVTSPGSSGGIYFDRGGITSFAMHLEKSSGLCGGVDQKYGVALSEICKKGILSKVSHVCQPL